MTDAHSSTRGAKTDQPKPLNSIAELIKHTEEQEDRMIKALQNPSTNAQDYGAD